VSQVLRQRVRERESIARQLFEAGTDLIVVKTVQYLKEAAGRETTGTPALRYKSCGYNNSLCHYSRPLLGRMTKFKTKTCPDLILETNKLPARERSLSPAVPPPPRQNTLSGMAVSLRPAVWKKQRTRNHSRSPKMPLDLKGEWGLERYGILFPPR
jgi:hypothetical protein